MVDEHATEHDSARAAARDRILDTAQELFGSRGFDAVSVSEIASAANVSTALIYYHFTDKESLLRALMLRGGEVFEPLVERLRTSGGSARERLAAYIEAWIAAVLDNASLTRIVVRPLLESGGPLSEEILTRISRNMEVIATVISQGVESGEFAPCDPTLAAECLFALLNTRAAAGVLNAAHLDRVSSDPHDVARFIARTYLGGLAIGAQDGAETC